MVVLFARCNRDHALVSVVPGHAVEFRARQKAYRDTVAAAFFHYPLQAQIMAIFRNTDPFKGSSACLQRLSDSIDAIDVIHLVLSLTDMAGRTSEVRSPACPVALSTITRYTLNAT